MTEPPTTYLFAWLSSARLSEIISHQYWVWWRMCLVNENETFISPPVCGTAACILLVQLHRLLAQCDAIVGVCAIACKRKISWCFFPVITTTVRAPA